VSIHTPHPLIWFSPAFCVSWQISSTDDPEDLLISCGWDAPAVASLGDETAHYGRWPFRCVVYFWVLLYARYRARMLIVVIIV